MSSVPQLFPCCVRGLLAEREGVTSKYAVQGASEGNDAASDAALPPPPGLSASPLDVELQLCSSAPKNDWAEKMARSALQRMAHAKSSLLAGAT